MSYIKDKNEYIFRIPGEIGFGKQLGRTVDMPTANLITNTDTSDITPGVYAVMMEICGKRYMGITHIGARPSVDNDNRITIETYIFDFNKDIYGSKVTLYGYSYIRQTRTFDSLLELKAQVEKDITIAKTILQDV